MEKERHVLVIFPHPDDESFGTSGTIMDFVAQGIPVTYLCMTLGEMGRNLGNPPLTNREGLPEIRRKELLDAAEILGCDVRMMGLRDKTVEFLDEDKIAEKVLAVIEEINPSLVISFYPPYAVHPDHDACGRIVINAMKRIPAETRPKLYAVAFSKNAEKELGKPDVSHDISHLATQKLTAIRAHRSQAELMTKGWDTLLEQNDPAILSRFTYENFYLYPFK